MSHTYFITGAQGCIGSWIVKALAERGDIPVVFDRSEDARRLAAIMEPADLERIQFIAGDITDVTAVRSALEDSGARRIIHLAGLQVPTCRARSRCRRVRERDWHVEFVGSRQGQRR